MSGLPLSLPEAAVSVSVPQEREIMKIKQDKCECVGVRCGAHPLGRCNQSPVERYEFRLAATGLVAPGDGFRLYCAACAKGLGAKLKKQRVRSAVHPLQVAVQMAKTGADCTIASPYVSEVVSANHAADSASNRA